MMFEWLNDIGNYGDRKIDRTEVPGFIVSTCLTSDEGYETAICDASGAHPVERYASGNAAANGHKRWVKKMTHNPPKTITKLGAWGIIEDEEKTLVARKGDRP